MLIKAGPLHLTALACDIAALLSERDLLRGPSGWRNADLRVRLDVLRGQLDHAAGATVDRSVCQRVKRTADLWRHQLGCSMKTARPHGHEDLDNVGRLLGLAYPDRIAQRQQGADARYVLTNGCGALFANPDPLASEPYLVIADLDGGTQWARIDLAAPIALSDIEKFYADAISETEAVEWDERANTVRASRQYRLGALVLSERALSKPDPSLISMALLQGIRQAGLATLAWTPELQQWRERVQFLHRIEGANSTWPDLSEKALIQTIDEWLGPYLQGITTLDRVKRLDLSTPLHALLGREQLRQLDRQAPTHLTVPSGSNIRIEYDTTDFPILAVRLQEMFGCKETPRVADGKVPVMVHLLSPAKRPVQVTRDLASFWANTYQDVRKELRGRYPKHHWPEDPLTAPPTAKTKRRTD
jgi:ATP-dependent helicase HrpB